MEIIDGLVELGFSLYEAKVYASLVRHPKATGYEVSKFSGVPRAKVYEVLESLLQKGFTFLTVEDGKQLYWPLDYNTLLDRHQSKLLSTVESLKTSFQQIESVGEVPPFLTILGADNIMAQIKEMCASSRTNLLLVGFSSEFNEILPELTVAEKRGVDSYILQYGNEDLGLKNQFFHSISPLQIKQLERYGRWFGLVKDSQEAILAQFGPAQNTALLSANLGFIMALTLWIQHDIAVYVFAEEAKDIETIQNISAKVNKRLHKLWTINLFPDHQ